MKPVVSMKNVSVVYGQGQGSEVAAVKNITLDIFPEEYVIFYGPSGSGKSTLLYLIAGLQAPTDGEVLIEDQNLYDLSEGQLMEFHRSSIGFIFQAFYLISNLSIWDNIALPQIFKELPANLRKQRIQELASRFGISENLFKKPAELSGGQQQRAAAARALINNPHLILADEPVGNLDTKNAQVMMNILKELNQKDRKTIILVTHNPAYLPYAHRVFYIRDGMVERESRPDKPNKEEGILSTPVAKVQLSDLQKKYPYLSMERLRAKILTREMLIPYDPDEQEKMEVMIEQYLSGKIDEQQLITMFDTTGTLGLSIKSETAIRLMRKIMNLKGELQIAQRPVDAQHPVEKKAEDIKNYLLETANVQVSEEQSKRLDEAVEKRLLDIFTPQDFMLYLDKPFSQGGLGLNKRLSKKISKNLEWVLTAKEVIH